MGDLNDLCHIRLESTSVKNDPVGVEFRRIMNMPKVAALHFSSSGALLWTQTSRL